MRKRGRRKALHGLVGGVGLVAGLGGYIGGLYPPHLATFAMLGIWIVGATLVNVLFEKDE